jgi:hypothetical protein
MDMYKEARWTFSEKNRVDWYETVVEGLLVKPRLPRFGILSTDCAGDCFRLLIIRNSPEFLGLPAESANPMALFADIGNMELNDKCKMCIEKNYPYRIEESYDAVPRNFNALREELMRFKDSLEDTEENAATKKKIDEIASKCVKIVESVTRDDIVEVISYYTGRGLYANIGVKSYTERYNGFQEVIEECHARKDELNLTCPILPSDLTPSMAGKHLENHADGPFSRFSTAGAPFPFWSKKDGTGALFESNDQATLSPVSGSGIVMSAKMTSLADYLDIFNYDDKEIWNPVYGRGSFADPSSRLWHDMVETNPFYAWFMADLELADTEFGQYCISLTAIQLSY